ncbi:MAG: hypothetical protein KZQ83_15570 [gamma proteobacterium symbiont of Taylorina sp.]|nr:hypothetical protein [gamma proteobacterium symbiont of Taylorina sp.]
MPTLTLVAASQKYRQYHLHDSVVQKAIKTNLSKLIPGIHIKFQFLPVNTIVSRPRILAAIPDYVQQPRRVIDRMAGNNVGGSVASPTEFSIFLITGFRQTIFYFL